MHGFLVRSFLALFVLCWLAGCNEKKTYDSTGPSAAGIPVPEFLEQQFPQKAREYNGLTNDSDRVRLLKNLADETVAIRPQIFRHLLNYSNDSLSFSHHLYFIHRLTGHFFKMNQLDSVVFYCRLGISRCENNPKYGFELAQFYRYMGNVYANFSRNAEAISCFDKAIQMACQHGDKGSQYRYISEIGRVYLNMKEIDKAIECYRKGKEFAKTNKDFGLLVYCLNSLGDICRMKKNYAEAIDYHETALKVHKLNTGVDHEQWATTSLGKCFLGTGNLSRAKKCFQIAGHMAAKRKIYDLQIQSYLHLSVCDERMNLFPSAIANGLKAYELCDKIPLLDIKVAVASNLAYLYEKSGQLNKALHFHKLYKALEDSMENKENFRKFAEAEFKLKEDKLLYKIVEDQQNLRFEQEKRKEESRRHTLVIVTVTVVLLLVLGFAAYVFRSLQQIRLKNSIIEQKQSEIVKSIQYASRIQNSFLPNEKYIEKAIKKLSRGSNE